MLKLKLFVLSAATVCLGRADLFNNFPADPGNSLLICGATAAGGCSPLNAYATGFTTVGANQLSQINVDIAYASGTQSIDLALYNTISGVPGIALDTKTVAITNTSPTIVGAAFSDIIAAGTYWVAVLPGGSDTRATWQESFLSAPDAYSGDNGVTWSSTPFPPGAAQVLGGPIATPEPSAIFLLAGVAGVLGIKIRRKRSST